MMMRTKHYRLLKRCFCFRGKYTNFFLLLNICAIHINLKQNVILNEEGNRLEILNVIYKSTCQNTWRIIRRACNWKYHQRCQIMLLREHRLFSWIKIDQLMSLALLFAQHVSNASTFIFRSLWLCVGILLWFDVCCLYGVVQLGWCGILMQAEALAFKTCWANNKASDISWSIFIQLWRWCMVQ